MNCLFSAWWVRNACLCRQHGKLTLYPICFLTYKIQFQFSYGKGLCTVFFFLVNCFMPFYKRLSLSLPPSLPQWDEVSVLDDRGRLIRTFEVCNVNQNPRVQDNWLATPFLLRYSAPRVFVTLRFSVRDCASLRTPSPSCRETLTLFYKQADSQRELERTWAAEVINIQTKNTY